MHSPRFVNITDLRSATRAEEEDDFDEQSADDSNGDLQMSGYQDVDDKDPVLTDIKLTCSDCEGEKDRRTQMEEKVREMSDNIQRLERKVDSLINALVSQGKNISNDAPSLVEVHSSPQRTTNV